ncbi:glycosyltransferase [Sphingomonas sp. CGMCC 1.13654]|uniref:Glycosyltransferase n=1 Tax=Sphingomonas chungangi TaxID=2683589 RepID=A0A838L862_9SPHN|nr:glycosyltransferase [Sphingomonas chungangi]MBA2934912.1 glycosyltransferase [Sphingomonas chungangi]MVW58223.1 glycosyltransferase [Sphingomonas chungangi]
MLRVLTLSTLFPDTARPTFGVFVERQTLGLAALPDVEVRVVAPIAAPPGILRRFGQSAGLEALPERETWKGLSIHRPRFPSLPGVGALNPMLMARALLPLLRTIRADFPFDVIDAEFFFPDGPAAARMGRALGAPVSIKARGHDIHHFGRARWTGRQVVRAGREAGGMLAVSAALKADMTALGLPAEKIRVHYTGVDLDRFKPVADRAAAKAALGVSGPLLLSVGALIPRKGHDLTIRALAELPGVTLMIAGKGTEHDALELLAREIGVADRVRLLGGQPHEALPALAAAADVGVLVSASEGLANAWVESLACGTPLVLSDVGGARELVDRPEAGRIVAREPAAIAAAVQELLASPPAPATVRATAERFTWDANAVALRTHLAELVA